MSRWRCGGCETRYALRLTRCPRCHSTSFNEEGAMPKISRSAGPTNAGVAKPPTPPAAPAPEPEPSPDTVAAGAVRTRKVRPKPSTDGEWMEWERDDSPPAAEHKPEPAPPEGGETSCHGSNSSPSTAPQKTTSKQSKTPRRKRGPLGSRSSQAPKESSSPGSPATGGPKTDALTDD